MNHNGIIGIVIVIFLCFVSVAQAMDDWQLHQRQFEMQMKLQEQQMREQMQESKLLMQMQENQFKQMQRDMRQQMQVIKQQLKFSNEQFKIQQPIGQQMQWQHRAIDLMSNNYRFSTNLMDLSRHSEVFQMRITDLTRDSNLQRFETIASYLLDSGMSAAMKGFVKTSSEIAALFHTAGLQTALSHNRMHWVALTKGFNRVIGPNNETQLMLPLRWNGRGTLPDWYQTNLAETNFSRISRITQPVLAIALTAGSAAQTFLDTANYIGRSMQIINPPTPGTRITSPDMGLKPGHTTAEGLHNLKTWVGDFTTNRIRPVQSENTKIINLDNNINLGNTRITRSGFLRETQITVTPTNSIERFMLKLYPVGSYFDPMTSTVTTTRQWSITTREITMPGGSFNSGWNNSINSLPRSSFNTFNPSFNTFNPSFGSPQTNIPDIQIPDIKLPDINTRLRGF